MEILAYLISLITLVLFIMVLIKLFKKEGVLLGILGIICALYTFIWGWINHKKQKITNLMIAWTVCIIIGIILNYLPWGIRLYPVVISFTVFLLATSLVPGIDV